MRVTLQFESEKEPRGWPHLSAEQILELPAKVVPASVPRTNDGYYWGYDVRMAPSISAVLTECPYRDADKPEDEQGYDCVVGTSERGVPLSSILPETSSKRNQKHDDDTTAKLPRKFKHLLLVFGGVQGLEPAVANDPEIDLPKDRAHELFDHWVNLVPGQGSRTIRTEEAVWLGLMGLRDYVMANENV